MIAKLLPFVALALFTGCISVDCGYAPNVDVETYTPPQSRSFPVTFSVKHDAFRTDIIGQPDEAELREKVQEALEGTGLFSEVRAVDKPETDEYHISFTFHSHSPTEGQEFCIGLLAGYTLLIVPTWENLYFDGAATVYLRGKPVYASGAAEKQKVVIWLPFGLIGAFWNCAVGWHYTEKGVINNLVNDVSAYHDRRFVRGKRMGD